MWSARQLIVHAQINSNYIQHFTSSRYTEWGRRNTWNVFPGHVVEGVLQEWVLCHAILEASICFRGFFILEK